MFADAAWLNNPELAGDVSPRKGISEGLDGRPEQGPGSWRWHSQNRNACMFGRLDENRVPELDIECDQASPLVCADPDELRVGNPAERLFVNRSCIMASRPEYLGELFSEILVELQPHAVRRPGMSMYRSRAISAA